MQQIDWATLPEDKLEGFQAFHQANPHILVRLVSMTRQLTTKGHKKVGMKMLFEILRWDHMLSTDDHPFKLNNNYTAFYSRLIGALYPDLAGVFEQRKSVADGEVVH